MASDVLTSRPFGSSNPKFVGCDRRVCLNLAGHFAADNSAMSCRSGAVAGIVPDQVLQGLRDCRVTQYAIAQETGIDRSTLSRFMRAERGLRLTELDTLAAYLRLEVRMLGPLKKE